MARKLKRSPKAEKPASVAVGPLKAHPRKPPCDSDTRWWWQVVYYQDREQITAKGAGIRATPEEIFDHLVRLVASGTYTKPQPEIPAEQTLNWLMRKWLADRKERRDRTPPKLSPNSYLTYHQGWKRVEHTLGERGLDELTLETFQAWVDAEEARGASARSINQWYRTIGQAWNWGRKRGFTPHTNDLPRPELPKIDGYVYSHITPTRPQAMAIVDACAGWRRLAAELLLATGARIGEIVSLTWDRWDRVGGRLHLVGKTGARWFPVQSYLQDMLKAWEESAPRKSNYLLGPKPISAARRMVKTLRSKAEKLGVGAITPHSFRRLASTELVSIGTDPKSYEALMGHSYTIGLRWYAQSVERNVQTAANHLGRTPTPPPPATAPAATPATPPPATAPRGEVVLFPNTRKDGSPVPNACTSR